MKRSSSTEHQEIVVDVVQIVQVLSDPEMLQVPRKAGKVIGAEH